MLPHDFKLQTDIPGKVQQVTFTLLMESVHHIFQFVCTLLSLDKKSTNSCTHNAIRCIFIIFVLLVNLLPQATHDEHGKLFKWLKHFNIFTNRHPHIMSSLLHFACLGYTDLPVPTKVIQFLLHNGSNPNHLDERNGPPVHCLVFCSFTIDKITIQKIQLLVDAGAHLDLIDTCGQSALGRLKTVSRMKRIGINNLFPELHVLVNRVPLLGCRCSQVIRHNRIPFENQQLPPALVSFLKSHGADVHPNITIPFGE